MGYVIEHDAANKRFVLRNGIAGRYFRYGGPPVRFVLVAGWVVTVSLLLVGGLQGGFRDDVTSIPIFLCALIGFLGTLAATGVLLALWREPTTDRTPDEAWRAAMAAKAEAERLDALAAEGNKV